MPFVLPLPTARPRVLLQGRIDLLARRGDRPVVRDYKYAHDHAAGRLQYGPQLDAYRLAVALAEGCDDVGAEIVFLRDGPVVHALPRFDPAAETAALVDASDELAAALAGRGGRERFPRRPPGPDACRALGCAYVGRCWRADVTDTARRPPTESAGA